MSDNSDQVERRIGLQLSRNNREATAFYMDENREGLVRTQVADFSE